MRHQSVTGSGNICGMRWNIQRDCRDPRTRARLTSASTLFCEPGSKSPLASCRQISPARPLGLQERDPLAPPGSEAALTILKFPPRRAEGSVVPGGSRGFVDILFSCGSDVFVSTKVSFEPYRKMRVTFSLPAISKWQHANSPSKSFKRRSFADRRPS